MKKGDTFAGVALFAACRSEIKETDATDA